MKRGRTLLVIAIIVALLATAGTQKLALQQRRAALHTLGGTSSASLANMDSFALALLLGGLRGPLVMFLWMQSETQKTAKDLEGVETQIEWIRLLQPEFDTVHLFQIWNKAYNISVQMASLANKYSVILDSLEYARNVERQRPDNINIIMSMASIYNDKFANAAERTYYRRRVLEDTQYRPEQARVRAPGARPTRHPSILDPEGNILPQLLATRFDKPSNPDEFHYDGSEMQFLQRYAPFPYGVPAYGLAYNYFQRTKALQQQFGQRHIQISSMVVSSRPALSLRAWAEVEWESAIREELSVLGKDIPLDRFDAHVAGGDTNPASLSPERAKEQADAIAHAIYRYTMALRLMQDAEREFAAHLANPEYQMNVDMYRSHVDHVQAARNMVVADRALLQAIGAPPERQKELFQTARQLYNQSLRDFRIIRIRYFTAFEMLPRVLPPNTSHTQLHELTDQQLAQIIQRTEQLVQEQGWDMFGDDAAEYMAYIHRAIARMKLLPQ